MDIKIDEIKTGDILFIDVAGPYKKLFTGANYDHLSIAFWGPNKLIDLNNPEIYPCMQKKSKLYGLEIKHTGKVGVVSFDKIFSLFPKAAVRSLNSSFNRDEIVIKLKQFIAETKDLKGGLGVHHALNIFFNFNFDETYESETCVSYGMLWLSKLGYDFKSLKKSRYLYSVGDLTSDVNPTTILEPEKVLFNKKNNTTIWLMDWFITLLVVAVVLFVIFLIFFKPDQIKLPK